jgi:hypothetical protein
MHPISIELLLFRPSLWPRAVGPSETERYCVGEHESDFAKSAAFKLGPALDVELVVFEAAHLNVV